MRRILSTNSSKLKVGIVDRRLALQCVAIVPNFWRVALNAINDDTPPDREQIAFELVTARELLGDID